MYKLWRDSFAILEIGPLFRVFNCRVEIARAGCSSVREFFASAGLSHAAGDRSRVHLLKKHFHLGQHRRVVRGGGDIVQLLWVGVVVIQLLLTVSKNRQCCDLAGENIE